MSQNNLTVATGSGVTVRTGFNNAIQSLASQFAGAADPATFSPSCAFPYMLWPDTGNSLLKQRNYNNTAWVTIGIINADGTFSINSQYLNFTPSGNLVSTNQRDINAELDSRGYGDNLFINPFFQIWQRGFSFVIAAGGSAYTSDRKLIVNNTNQSVTITRYQYANKQYSLRMAATTTAPTTGTVDLHERSEKDDLLRKTGVGCFEGQYVNVQYEVDGADPTFFFRQFFGTGGSPSSSVDTTVSLTKTSLGGTANKYVGSVLIPSISGKTIGTTANTDYLQSTLSIPLRSSAVSVLAMQCQYGKVNSLIRKRSNELQLCQEYYEKTYDLSTSPGTATSTGYIYNVGLSGGVVAAVVRYKIEKRVTPTITIWDINGNSNTVTTYTSGGTPSSRTPNISGTCTTSFIAACTTSDTAIAFQCAIDAEIY